MKIYLVGGAVRDQLLNRPVKERDWVVVGATPEEMLKKGYRQVGKDFPVFLHPETNEEYALARTERKIGRGYTGFAFDASTAVTLEEDLKRRDLTINAIAETPEGKFVDPYHGQADLKNKILRHVSEAFVEDPVRILRVARFAARFHDFSVAPETNELMKQMVQSGEVDALVPERVWKELERALAETHPERFFQVLAGCDALAKLFPALLKSDGLQLLAQIAVEAKDPEIRFAALFYDLPIETIQLLCQQYRVPNNYRDLAILTAKYITQCRRARELSAEEIVNLLQDTDAFRREERFTKLLQICEARQKIKVRGHWVVTYFPKNSSFLLECLQLTKQIDVKSLLLNVVDGREISVRLYQARVKKIAEKLHGSDDHLSV